MIELTKRDREILRVLTLRVRTMTLQQIARTWWSEDKNGICCARSRLRSLEASGLVEIRRALAHPEISLYAPIIAWQPGRREPDYGPASYRLQTRWTQHCIPTTCIAGTRTAGNLFGGHGGRLPREVERTHDIHLAAVFLLYRQHFFGSLSGWIFEEQLRKGRRRGEMLPDVIFELPSGRRVIEFGGAYSKQKLKAFHQYCKERELPYEVW